MATKPKSPKSVTQKLVTLPRDYLVVMMESGYVFLTTRKYKEAMEVFEGVAALTPHSEIPLIAMGNVYAAQQLYDDAVKAFRRALKTEPKSALAHAHLGEILLVQDEKEKALEALTKALELEPEGRVASFAKALLDAVEKGVLPPSGDGLLGTSGLKKDL